MHLSVSVKVTFVSSNVERGAINADDASVVTEEKSVVPESTLEVVLGASKVIEDTIGVNVVTNAEDVTGIAATNDADVVLSTVNDSRILSERDEVLKTAAS